MRTLLKVISGIAIGAILSVPALASAQDLGVRGEAGVAVPLTGPQVDHFHVGGDFAIKGVIGLGSYVDVGPMVSVLAVPAANAQSSDGAAWGLGGTLRLKRPHNEKNTGTGWTAVSPWVDGDLQYVRTGVLDRAAASLGVGAAFPTSDARNIWVGPYARYLDVVQDYRKGFDNTDAHVFIVGLSLELGPRVAAKQVAPPPPPPREVAKLPPPAPPPPAPPPVVEEREERLHAVVQFAVDSTKLDSTATAILDKLVEKIKSGTKVSAITVEGNASIDGPLAHNKILAAGRAKVVVDYLVAHGIDRSKLIAENMGVSNPVVSNKTLKGRQANRRSEVFVNVVISVKVGS